MADKEVDLYGDDFYENDTLKEDGGIDLYDDVLATNPMGVKHDPPITRLYPSRVGDCNSHLSMANPLNHVMSPSSKTNYAYEGRKYSVYIGNMTWWTSDVDITEKISEIGVGNVVDIKFHENRVNGQSKGFCVVHLTSEESMRSCLDMLPKMTIHGHALTVLPYNKLSLAQFEQQSKQCTQAGQMSGEGKAGPPGARCMRYQNQPRLSGPPPSYGAPPPTMLGGPPPMMSGPPPGFIGGPPPEAMLSQPPPFMPSVSMPVNGPPMSLSFGMPPPGMLTGPPPAGTLTMTRPPDFNMPPPGFDDPRMGPPIMPMGGPPPPNQGSVSPRIYEHDLEELLSQNRKVAHTAIDRATEDAKDGDYSAAVETLVTAISLIKQSKIADHDICMNLTASLQETLHQVETEYSHVSGSGHRRQDRSHDSRDRREPRPSRHKKSEHDRSSRRDRSRSRGHRRHRTRSRDRSDRHHRSRDRYPRGGDRHRRSTGRD